MVRRRRTRSFVIDISLAMVLTAVLYILAELAGMLLSGEGDWGTGISYFFLVPGGLLVGVWLCRRVGSFPSLEGLYASSVLALLVIGKIYLFQQSATPIDYTVETLLKFEAHFASLYLGAFIVFLLEGGGIYYPRFVGLRYLRFKMITGITVIGVALGVAGLIVVLSVMSGFETDLREKIIGANAHAIIQKKALDFSEYRQVEKKVLKIAGVKSASPFAYSEVMASSEFNLSGVYLRGIDPATVGSVTRLEMKIGSLKMLTDPALVDKWLETHRGPGAVVNTWKKDEDPKPTEKEDKKPDTGSNVKDKDQSPPDEKSEDASSDDEVPMPGVLMARTAKKPPPGALIGAELKKILKVDVGDRINLVSPLSEELGPAGPMPKARSFRVAGVFYTGMYEYDAKSVYVNLPDAQDFLGTGDSVSGIALRFDNIDDARHVCDTILGRLGGWPYATRTWYDMNKSLFSALKMEKVAMFLVLVIVILVSAFGIVSTLIMLVWEKVKEIAILKSMGATGDGVMKIFMVEGLTIGIVGTVLGMVVGWGACLALKMMGLQMNPDVYYIEALPVNTDPIEFLLIGGIALHISFIATIYPSRRASRLRPVEGLRYD